MRRRSLIAGAAIATLTWGVIMSDTASAQPKPDPENTLYMDLKQGRVVIQMLPDLAPKHVERIKKLAREGFYDNTPFHRVIEGFMAQGGDPTGTGTRRLASCRTCRPSSPPSGTSCAAPCGMARTPNPNSANSQFFIMFAPAPHLDGQYTIWGQVVAGHGARGQDQARQRLAAARCRTRTGSCTCGWRPT